MGSHMHMEHTHRSVEDSADGPASLKPLSFKQEYRSKPRPAIHRGEHIRRDDEGGGDSSPVVDTYSAVRHNAAKNMMGALKDLDARDQWGWTALMHASEMNHKQGHVKVLVEASADTSVRSVKAFGMYDAGVAAIDIAERIHDRAG